MGHRQNKEVQTYARWTSFWSLSTLVFKPNAMKMSRHKENFDCFKCTESGNGSWLFHSPLIFKTTENCIGH